MPHGQEMRTLCSGFYREAERCSVLLGDLQKRYSSSKMVCSQWGEIPSKLAALRIHRRRHGNPPYQLCQRSCEACRIALLAQQGFCCEQVGGRCLRVERHGDRKGIAGKIPNSSVRPQFGQDHSRRRVCRKQCPPGLLLRQSSALGLWGRGSHGHGESTRLALISGA